MNPLSRPSLCCRWMLFLLGICSFGNLKPGLAANSPRPNILLILADDLGWSDLACYGADLHETPHLDRLAREGLRFTEAYASSSVCTPTRAALMTGKHPARLGMTIWGEAAAKPPPPQRLVPPPAAHNLSRTEITIATHLQTAGYLTALVGKWHLGDAEHYPEAHGFDINVGGTHWGAPRTYFYPYRGSGRFGPEFRYVPHLEFGQPGEYLTDRLADEALKIIDRAGDQPWFLYLAHHAPHTPIEAKQPDVEHFQKKLRPDLRHQNSAYAAMIKSLDESVGRVLARLEQRNLTGRTLVIFTSDNGGYINKPRGQDLPVTDNFPLRSGKGSLYEGGLRVPLIVKWPGVTSAGSICSEPVVLTDLFHTLMNAAQLPPGDSPPTDGVDLSPLLKNPSSKLQRDALFFHYPHYYPTTTPVSAMRAGSWKLLEYHEDRRVELFNLKEDPGEKTDLARRTPEKAGELLQRLRSWRESVGARLPVVNPEFKETK